jgi:hypothetical protein
MVKTIDVVGIVGDYRFASTASEQQLRQLRKISGAGPTTSWQAFINSFTLL